MEVLMVLLYGLYHCSKLCLDWREIDDGLGGL